MVRPHWTAAVIVGVVGIGSASVQGTVTISCTPTLVDVEMGATPNGNDVVLMECFLTTDVTFTLNSYQLTYPCSASPGVGASGSVGHLSITGGTPCTFAGEDPDCVFDGFQGICGNPTVCFSPAQCGGAACLEDPNNPGVKYCENSGTCSDPSPFVDDTRLDFALRGVVGGYTINIGTDNCPGTLPVLGASADQAGQGVVINPIVPPALPKYLGSFYYRISPCAAGTFTWTTVGNGNPPNGTNATRVMNTANVAQLVIGGVAGVEVAVGLCCSSTACLGNHNPYCCINVQGGLISKLETTCTPPSFANCGCTADAHCGDFNPCTNDICAPGNPASDAVGCLHVSNVPPGNCCDPTGAGPLDPLDDGNPCTVDSCEGGTYPAIHNAPAANGQMCTNDGNECTIDTCLNGQCIHDAAAANGGTCATDNNACTADVCNNGTCTHSASGANGEPCQGDGVYCTLDICSAGACTHPNVNTYPCELLSDCPFLATSCTGSIGNPGLCVCMQPPGPCYGDIVPLPNGNDLVDLDDILCCLDEFIFPGICPQADIFPCGGGNGIVDVDDIQAMLAAFTGFASCGFPCG